MNEKDEQFAREFGARVATARKARSMVQQIAAIEQLPKIKQHFVSQMLETVLAQAQQ
ncbi:Helix-turn-helix transcriptional regulator [Paraburkholderia sacchari]|uniref:hypothetical protein n=1 Tax=Paraburkholderia sacchari TaxID=159450 RepID=UPI0039A551E7